MEQIINNTTHNGVRTNVGVKARSGLLISKTPSYEPVKITRLKNEKVIVHYLD